MWHDDDTGDPGSGSARWTVVSGIGTLVLGLAVLGAGVVTMAIGYDAIEPIGQGHHPLEALLVGVAFRPC